MILLSKNPFSSLEPLLDLSIPLYNLDLFFEPPFHFISVFLHPCDVCTDVFISFLGRPKITKNLLVFCYPFFHLTNHCNEKSLIHFISQIATNTTLRFCEYRFLSTQGLRNSDFAGAQRGHIFKYTQVHMNMIQLLFQFQNLIKVVFSS